jgi:hypothetical protein
LLALILIELYQLIALTTNSNSSPVVIIKVASKMKSVDQREPSWFPELDKFVELQGANIGGIQGVLTSWVLLKISRNKDFPVLKLRYQVLKNRFCFNIGRPHKSNGIILEVDLMCKELTQSCWDVDCQGKKSPPITIPANLVPDIADLLAYVEAKTKLSE